jgi:hypothetical protein
LRKKWFLNGAILLLTISNLRHLQFGFGNKNLRLVLFDNLGR